MIKIDWHLVPPHPIVTDIEDPPSLEGQAASGLPQRMRQVCESEKKKKHEPAATINSIPFMCARVCFPASVCALSLCQPPIPFPLAP